MLKRFTKHTRILTFFTILFLSSLLRFVYLPNIAIWGHDSSRDMVRVFKFFEYGEIIYRGPVFSVIWGFLSPLYYYIQAPFFYLFNFHPISAPLLSSIITLITLGLIFYTTSQIFNFETAVFASILYGFSFNIILEGAYGLNPTYLTPFAVLFFYSLVKVFKDNKPKFYYLLAFSFSMLINFHPSGFFTIVPLITLFLMYRPKVTFKTLSVSSFILFIFAVVPYAIVEKKFNFWNYNQFMKYLNGDITSEVSVDFIESIYNFFYVLSKNISLVLFNNLDSGFLIISLILFSSLVVFLYRSFKNRNTVLSTLLTFLLTYTLTFMFLVKFNSSNFNAWWFHPVFFPLFTVYLGYLLYILFKRSSLAALSIITLFMLINLFSFETYSPPYDTYKSSKTITEVIRTDSQGKTLEIEGIDHRPIKYMLWYFEKEENLKDKYFTWVKWEDKNADTSLVYYINKKEPDVLDEKVNTIYTKYKLSRYKKIYTADTWDLYRVW